VNPQSVGLVALLSSGRWVPILKRRLQDSPLWSSARSVVTGVSGNSCRAASTA